jgi:hypothetical protein
MKDAGDPDAQRRAAGQAWDALARTVDGLLALHR